MAALLSRLACHLHGRCACRRRRGSRGDGAAASQIATAMALAVPAAGGVQRAFGTDAKSLQVGFAVDAGIRAARLAAAGARADPSALDSWLRLVGGDPAALDLGGPAVPDGLAVKIYPCCYALQRPISTLSQLAAQMAGRGLDPADVSRIVLRTPEATVVPLIHYRPDTGLQGKFSLEYGAAAALLDRYPGFGSFTDAAVRRPAARHLTGLVKAELDPGGTWLLDGRSRQRCTVATGPCCGAVSSSLRARRAARRPLPSCRPSSTTASAGWIPTQPPGPGRTRPTCSAGSCHRGPGRLENRGPMMTKGPTRKARRRFREHR